MNDSSPDIQIFKPFGQAFELMKRILFQPFDLTKWCVLGFAVFLSHFATGGANLNYNFGRWGESGSSHSSSSHFFWRDASPWLLIAAGIAILLGIAVALALWWIGCRARFIFTDCVVRNRAAIAEPWREYRREGNGLFLFLLLAFFGLLFVAGLGLVPVVVIWLKTQRDNFSWPGLVALIGFLFVFVLLVVCWTVVQRLMVPIMYRLRCPAHVAFVKALSLAAKYPGEIILWILFCLALTIVIAVGMVSVMCLTCCVVLIPYVGTVITLPVPVTFHAFLLFFLRQFGPDYDVWSGGPPMGLISDAPTTPPAPA